jgi:hypothetical protein
VGWGQGELLNKYAPQHKQCEMLRRMQTQASERRERTWFRLDSPKKASQKKTLKQAASPPLPSTELTLQAWLPAPKLEASLSSAPHARPGLQGSHLMWFHQPQGVQELNASLDRQDSHTAASGPATDILCPICDSSGWLGAGYMPTRWGHIHLWFPSTQPCLSHLMGLKKYL